MAEVGGGSATLIPPAVSQQTAPTISSPSDFSAAVLATLGLPITATNIQIINAWQQAEGQWGATGSYNAQQMHNPLNTETDYVGGSSGLPGTSTLSFPTWNAGVANTATFMTKNDPGIISALKASDPNQFALALAQSGWGTSPANWQADFSSTPAPTPGQLAGWQDWAGNIASGAGTALRGAANAVGGVVGGVDALSTLASDLTSGAFWRRVGISALGLALIGVGIAIFIATSTPGRKAISEGESVAKLAAVA